jgi:hypothetical protein
MSGQEGWQPIDTAPAAMGCGDDQILVVGGPFQKPALVLPDGDWWRMGKAKGRTTFTHWMPLPPAPEAA